MTLGDKLSGYGVILRMAARSNAVGVAWADYDSATGITFKFHEVSTSGKAGPNPTLTLASFSGSNNFPQSADQELSLASDGSGYVSCEQGVNSQGGPAFECTAFTAAGPVTTGFGEDPGFYYGLAYGPAGYLLLYQPMGTSSPAVQPLNAQAQLTGSPQTVDQNYQSPYLIGIDGGYALGHGPFVDVQFLNAQGQLLDGGVSLGTGQIDMSDLAMSNDVLGASMLISLLSTSQDDVEFHALGGTAQSRVSEFETYPGGIGAVRTVGERHGFGVLWNGLDAGLMYRATSLGGAPLGDGGVQLGPSASFDAVPVPDGLLVAYSGIQLVHLTCP